MLIFQNSKKIKTGLIDVEILYSISSIDENLFALFNKTFLYLNKMR